MKALLLSQNALCQQFGIGAKSVAAKARRREQTSQEYLYEQTGWRYNESERKYYPPSK